MKKILAENKGSLAVSSLVILLPGLLGWRVLWESIALPEQKSNRAGFLAAAGDFSVVGSGGGRSPARV